MGEFGPGLEYGPFAWTGNKSDNIYNDLAAHPDIPRSFGNSGFTSFASLDDVPVVAPNKDLNIPGYAGWYHANYPDGKPYRYNNENDRDLLPDEMSADFAIEKLKQDHDKPFFLKCWDHSSTFPMACPQRVFRHVSPG